MSEYRVKKILVAIPSDNGVMPADVLPHLQAVVVSPMRYGRSHYLSDCGRNETFNVAVEKAREAGTEYILFWEPQVLPYLNNALMYLLDAMDRYEHISFCSWVPSCIPNEVRPVRWGDPGFMLARTEAFDKLDPPYFTDNDIDLGARIEAAGLRWYEHGGAVCERIEAA